MSGSFGNGSAQPHLHTSRSFPRMDSTDTNSSISAKQNTPEPVNTSTQPLSGPTPDEEKEDGPDLFERRASADSGAGGEGQGDEGFVLSRSVQDPSEELPIELISLTDRSVKTISTSCAFPSNDSHQVHQLLERQSAQLTSHDRENLLPVSGLLRACRISYRYPHLRACISHQP